MLVGLLSFAEVFEVIDGIADRSMKLRVVAAFKYLMI